jgi:fermentation-respiration switch protein FrsA (DUF1100 family)
MPVLIIHGEKAHSHCNSEASFDKITGETKTNGVTPEPYTGVYPLGNTKIGNKELYIVEGASHVDLYDNLDKIPFDKIESFLKESLEV